MLYLAQEEIMSFHLQIGFTRWANKVMVICPLIY